MSYFGAGVCCWSVTMFCRNQAVVENLLTVYSIVKHRGLRVVLSADGVRHEGEAKEEETVEVGKKIYQS